MNIKTLEHTNQDFPNFLPLLHDPPAKIFYRGLPLKHKHFVSIVGSRKPTNYGQQATHDLAHKLALQGVAIVSGLALGVDVIAHKAALQAGGKTVAVLPCSLERIYPATHNNIAKQIEQNGTLVSEYPKGAPIYKNNFIARNRIVAALGDVLLITEAAERSGTLSTARFALELGKTVMVVPGSIYSPFSRGTNNLLKMGAAPVTDVADILAELGISENDTQDMIARTPKEQAVLELISDGVSAGEELQLRSKLNPDEFLQTMTDLEINGAVKCIGGNQWVKLG